MFVLKIALYVITLTAAFFFGFRELKLKRQLTDAILDQERENASDFDSLYEIRRDSKRERILRNLPRGTKSKLNVAIGLKLLFLAAFCIEILILQR